MRKEQKTALVAEITEGLGRASIAIVSEYRGMTAGEATEVRRKLRAVRGELRVAKNTLIRLAIKDTAFSQLDGQLGGPVGLILSFADQLLGLLMAPATQVVRLLNEPGSALVRVIDAIGKKNGDAAPAAGNATPAAAAPTEAAPTDAAPSAGTSSEG